MEQKKLIRFEITKIRRNVEKSYQTGWLQMHYSREKRCQRTKIQRLTKYATTNLQRNIIRQNLFHKNVCDVRKNAKRTNWTVLQWDNKLRRNVNETTKSCCSEGARTSSSKLRPVSGVHHPVSLDPFQTSCYCRGKPKRSH